MKVTLEENTFSADQFWLRGVFKNGFIKMKSIQPWDCAVYWVAYEVVYFDKLLKKRLWKFSKEENQTVLSGISENVKHGRFLHFMSRLCHDHESSVVSKTIRCQLNLIRYRFTVLFLSSMYFLSIVSLQSTKRIRL